MSKRKLPQAKAFRQHKALDWGTRADAMERWAPRAADADPANTISIYDVIGQDFWTGEGVTAKRIGAALRSIGAKDVVVNINSPGGDMFEGLAIYNLLREHPGEVTVKVMGLAASAASIIAMAGDRIEMGLGSFMMIHNSWGLVVGNQFDFREASDTFAEFDAAMADIYVARTSGDRAEIEKMMAADTWLRAEAAIEAGFADGTFEAPAVPKTAEAKAKYARAALDAYLVKAGLANPERAELLQDAFGSDAAKARTARERIQDSLSVVDVPRSERRRLLQDAAGTPGAAGPVTPRADFDMGAALRLMNILQAK